MTQSLLLLSAALLINISISAQSFFGKAAQNEIQNAKEIHKNIKTQQIDFIEFNNNQRIALANLSQWIAKQYKIGDKIELKGKRPLRLFKHGQEPKEIEPGSDINFLL